MKKLTILAILAAAAGCRSKPKAAEPEPAPTAEAQPAPEPGKPFAGATPPPAVDGSVGYPLAEALASEDKRVRYSAARAMVTINPQRRKLGMELVIPSLVDALGEQGIRVALVVYDVQDDNDRNFINGFRRTLTRLNLFPVIATSGSEGVVKAKQFPTEDVIIIQRKIASQIYFREDAVRKPVVETVFDTLRDDVRTKNIPRVILSQGEAEDLDARKAYDMTAQGWIKKDTHELDLKALLEKLFDLPEAKKDAKDRADEMSRMAAETLASIDPTNTLYPFRDAVDALIKTVNPEVLREDFIRIPACRALGRYGDQRAVDVLAKVISDRDASPDKAARQKAVRWEAAKALSQVFRQTGQTPTDDVFGVILKNLKDGDYDIELACAEAAGNAKLSNKQRLQLSEHRRLQRDAYTHEDP
jgi:CheY-like chemotaxis protein